MQVRPEQEKGEAEEPVEGEEAGGFNRTVEDSRENSREITSGGMGVTGEGKGQDRRVVREVRQSSFHYTANEQGQIGPEELLDDHSSGPWRGIQLVGLDVGADEDQENGGEWVNCIPRLGG